MATLTVRNIDSELHGFLRSEAAAHGHSMEAEIRAVLKQHMQRNTRAPGELARAIRARFAGVEGAEDLAPPDRRPLPAPPDLGA